MTPLEAFWIGATASIPVLCVLGIYRIVSYIYVKRHKKDDYLRPISYNPAWAHTCVTEKPDSSILWDEMIVRGELPDLARSVDLYGWMVAARRFVGEDFISGKKGGSLLSLSECNCHSPTFRRNCLNNPRQVFPNEVGLLPVVPEVQGEEKSEPVAEMGKIECAKEHASYRELSEDRIIAKLMTLKTARIVSIGCGNMFQDYVILLRLASRMREAKRPLHVQLTLIDVGFALNVVTDFRSLCRQMENEFLKVEFQLKIDIEVSYPKSERGDFDVVMMSDFTHLTARDTNDRIRAWNYLLQYTEHLAPKGLFVLFCANFLMSYDAEPFGLTFENYLFQGNNYEKSAATRILESLASKFRVQEILNLHIGFETGAETVITTTFFVKLLVDLLKSDADGVVTIHTTDDLHIPELLTKWFNSRSHRVRVQLIKEEIVRDVSCHYIL